MPQNKTPEVFGLLASPGGRHMGYSTVAPTAYPTNISFQLGDYVIDPVTPAIRICTLAGAGQTATFGNANTMSTAVTQFSTAGTVFGTTASLLGFFGHSPSTQLVSTDTATVEAIRILKALGFCTTG